MHVQAEQARQAELQRLAVQKTAEFNDLLAKQAPPAPVAAATCCDTAPAALSTGTAEAAALSTGTAEAAASEMASAAAPLPPPVAPALPPTPPAAPQAVEGVSGIAACVLSQ